MLFTRLRPYWSLTKSPQTALLLITGLAGFATADFEHLSLPLILGVCANLYLAISGSTVLNMWYDQDIDAQMERTCWRPLPAHRIRPGEALALGLAFSAAGVGWALAMDRLYGAIVLGGVFFDFVIYTLWLKRRTPWAIVWGGVSGGMPVLAGRTLAAGQIDAVGVLLALGVLFWIPTHILTFQMRYEDDYRRAGVPTIPLRYGHPTARLVMALSSVAAAASMLLVAVLTGMASGNLVALLLLSGLLFLLALRSVVKPTPRLNFALFKFASVYMLGAMVLMVLGSL
jgi:protoheme IX farnesyltransferase